MLIKLKSKTFWKQELRSYFLIAFVSIGFAYITCPGCFEGFDRAIRNAFYSFLAWTFIWKGNEYLTYYINSKISWVNQTIKRFTVGVICMIGCTVLILFLIQYFFYIIGYSGSKFAPMGSYLFSIGITAFISVVLHSIEFFKSWRQAEINMEKLKNERLSSQYEALKNQVNPHFLFNSLNALTSLVYEDQDQAARFIQQLSKVYRYVLDNREKETVSLETEMHFVESYLYLQKIRYGDNLQFTIQIDKGYDYLVAPLSVQMLIENAIKHNIISKDEPLYVTIDIDDSEYLVIRNNLQIKNIINEYSGIGLGNIKERYFYFSKREVIIEKTQKNFTVKLPLIKKEKDSVNFEAIVEKTR